MMRTILFDLDGTLTDPKEGITRSVQYALSRFGIEVADLDRLEPFIGPPLKHSFMDLYSLSEEQALQGIEWYREYFRDRGIFENRVYEGIPEMLDELSTRGFSLAVATSKPTLFAGQILDHFGLSRFFRYVAGSNMDLSRSDKGEVIAHALEELACSEGNALMVGDREHDIIGAKKNGIPSVGVLYGYGGPEEIARADPTYTAPTVGGLSGLLAGFSQEGRS